MYIVVSTSKSKNRTLIEGHFPLEYLQGRLDAGDDIVVYSTYSNTLKVPCLDGKKLEWKDYPCPIDVLVKFQDDLGK